MQNTIYLYSFVWCLCPLPVKGRPFVFRSSFFVLLSAAGVDGAHYLGIRKTTPPKEKMGRRPSISGTRRHPGELRGLDGAGS